ncbi:shufflon system plasmid conjugative transfer pilus tip adhesin PilV [Acidithiobacillus albertensis]|uniref:shufflon system plasmid conjugative transfer pilus tip adhesin PilV n=1 Tax=Acidithiobacillus albertensis TaxID=119978 RepID=UPI001C06F7C7|nr:shufflon system plasmid conjugative transfer pilus tip adhesin PilV [Acidithiobacillus albertensis]MBU2742276.1 shufflon system plasmid conjugative transfer pilus tip adhesin PilV [Acidithiobacillus albertensis]
MNPIAVLFAVIISALAVPAVYTAMSSQQQQELSTAAAIQMARVEKAAEAYITANAGAIESVATGSSPAVITVPMLESTGYLPNGFTSVNPFGQTWEVQVLQPTSGNLQALVVSYGGNSVKAKVAGQVAQIAGASGGVIGGGSGEYAVPGCTGGEACGAYDGWSVTTSGYQNIQPGHFAALLAYSNGQLQSDYLYRVAVPGQPQLNTMQTNLNMGANNINNAKNVNVNQNISAGVPGTAETGYCQTDAQGHCIGQIAAAGQSESDLPAGWWGGIISRDVYGTATIAAGTNNQVSAYMNDAGNIGANGNVVANGTVQGGYVNSTGDVNAQYNSTANNAFAMDNGSWWANNAGDSSQSGNAYVGGQVTANYDATLGTAGGSANVGWGCGPNGAIAANANGSGQVLACQGGSWQAMGSTNLVPIGTWNNIFWQPENEDLGWYNLCVMVSYGTNGGGQTSVSPVSGPNAQGQYLWNFSSEGDDNVVAECFDLQ